jgi:hypothetical protein
MRLNCVKSNVHYLHFSVAGILSCLIISSYAAYMHGYILSAGSKIETVMDER